MNKLACRYAVAQFMPHAETEEFVNIGVVLACPQTGYFDFRLQSREHERVTKFFDELSPEMYWASVLVMSKELEYVRAQFHKPRNEDLLSWTRAIFDRTTHAREALVRFSSARVVLTDSPEVELDRLYRHYVERSFATGEFVETEMTRRLSDLLETLHLQEPFHPRTIGDDQLHASFPLVQQRGDQVLKVIKPLDLDKPEANAIYDHGDAWVQKIKRLRSRKLLSADVLFALAPPPHSDINRRHAFEEIRDELLRLDALAVAEDARESIVNFAIGVPQWGADARPRA